MSTAEVMQISAKSTPSSAALSSASETNTTGRGLQRRTDLLGAGDLQRAGDDRTDASGSCFQRSASASSRYLPSPWEDLEMDGPPFCGRNGPGLVRREDQDRRQPFQHSVDRIDARSGDGAAQVIDGALG